MSKINLDIDEGAVHDLVINSLKDMRKNLYTYYEARQAGTGFAVFSVDSKEDLKKIKKLLKSLDRVIDWCLPCGKE